MNTQIQSAASQEKIYLPIGANYVEHWGFWEATREILQNAIDTKNFTVSKMESSGVLKIKSLAGAMDLSTLMLGESSKRDDADSIGKYGEGYKLALLVLCRLGYKVLVKNGFDCWRVSIEMHPQLKADCLTVDVFKDTYIDDGDANEVSFMITGLAYEDFDIIENNYLCMDEFREGIEIIAENNGSYCFNSEKITDTKKVFVGGLYVCDLNHKYVYSYNFAPNVLELDRDRATVSDFYLQREVTRLLAESGNIEILIQLSSDGAEDVSDYYSVKEAVAGGGGGTYSEGYDEKTVAIAFESFTNKNGENAYPVDDNGDFNKNKVIMERCVLLGMVPVKVKKVLFDIIKDKFKGKLKVEKIKGKISDNLEDFIKGNRNKMEPIAIKRLKAIVDSIKFQGE